MALQTNLNKKDKITIAVVLFAALIFALIWFLIKPTVSSILTTSDKIEQAQLTQEQYKSKIMFLSSAETIYDKTVSDFNDSTSVYYEIMDSSEIDHMITSYVLGSGLFSESLSISMPKDSVDESPYIYSTVTAVPAAAAEGESDTEADANGAGGLLFPYENARRNARSTAASGIKSVGISLVVTGSRETCQAFIDDLCTKPALRITSFSWEQMDKIEVVNPVTGIVELKDPGTVRLRIDFNLYMADIADYDVVVPETSTEAED